MQGHSKYYFQINGRFELFCGTQNWTSQADVHLWTILYRYPYLYCYFFLPSFNYLCLPFTLTISVRWKLYLVLQIVNSCWLDVYLQIKSCWKIRHFHMFFLFFTNAGVRANLSASRLILEDNFHRTLPEFLIKALEGFRNWGFRRETTRPTPCGLFYFFETKWLVSLRTSRLILKDHKVRANAPCELDLKEVDST